MPKVLRSSGPPVLTQREKLLRAIDDPMSRAAGALMAFTGFSHWSLNRIIFREGLVTSEKLEPTQEDLIKMIETKIKRDDSK